MGDWPLISGTRLQTLGLSLATTDPTYLSTTGTNTKGAYSQISSSTPFEAAGLFLNYWLASANPTASSLDLAIGASGFEQIIVPDLLLNSVTTIGPSVNLFIPLAIPSGSRLAARIQTQSASQSSAVGVSATLLGGEFSSQVPCSICDAMGVTTSGATAGVAVTSGAANTQGSWTQIVASTTRNYRMLLISFTTATANTANKMLLDIGIGSSGNEVAIAPGFFGYQTGLSRLLWPQYFGPLPLVIPAGSRLSARLQAHTASTVGNVAIYGFGG